MSNSVSADFRMQYGSIVGMTQYYRPACLKKKEERKSLVSFAETNDTLLFDPSRPTRSLSCPDFDYDPDESDSEDEKIEKLPDPIEKKADKNKKGQNQTKQDTKVERVNPGDTNACVQKEDRKAAKPTTKTSKKWAKVSLAPKSDIVQEKKSTITVERDHKEFVGSLFSFDAANEYVAPRMRSKETCMVIQRATDHLQNKNSTLERDRRQLGKAKNLVAARLAIFESRP
mmetsp:Transcript_4027/g.7738  ORF Transcript_4027/g.7738 Transcript_4027/m.7738 type:complete len:229 (-) Transcript_4027:174-860(-)|eukprot:scaffold11774_cov142-Amphora_coffeaeformis.AAC.2